MIYSVLWMMGRPGIGKGEQSKLLKANYKIGDSHGEEISKFYHLTTGDMFKELARDLSNPLTQKINEWNSRGILFPDQLVLETTYGYITEKIRTGEFDPTKQRLIIDGYNRTPNQVKIMDGYFKTDATILLEAPIYVALLRMSQRQKTDPKPENSTPRLRFNRQLIYNNHIDSVLELLPQETIYKIDATRSIQEVHKDIVNILRP